MTSNTLRIRAKLLLFETKKNYSSVMSIAISKNKSTCIFHRKNNFTCSNKIYSQLFKTFALYFPKKELVYVKHPSFGEVYPIYMASKSKDNIKKITLYSISALIIISLNSYFLFLNLGLFSISQSKLLLISSNSTTLLSFIVLGYWIKTYLKYISDLSFKVKNMYLLPSGKKIIIEKFNGETDVVLNSDIYSSNIFNSMSQEVRKEKFYDSNSNSFYATVLYGRNKEVIFEGNILFLDYEIFNYVTSRFNIDTSQTGFNRDKQEAAIPLQFIKNSNKNLTEKIKKNIRFRYYSLGFLKSKYFSFTNEYDNRNHRFSRWLFK
jgi:hypothetical protein